MKKTIVFGRFLSALLAASAAAFQTSAAVTWWSVPAMSGEQRLPETVPSDGEEGGVVRIVLARDEYESGSFVLRSDTDLGKVRIACGRLVNGEGEVLPADSVDIKTVKVWYQNRNAWFSYFADTGVKLCPELLLHDENLIRVDREKKSNYARVTGSDGKVTEWWLNPPRQMDRRYFDRHSASTSAFPSMRPGFADADTLQPVALPANESRQFFITVRARTGTSAGIYRGTVSVKSDGPVLEIPVAVRVLDFALPRPKAYRNPEMDFRVCFYSYVDRAHIMALNGGDEELAWRQLEAVMADAVAHGQDMKWLPSKTGSADAERVIALMEKVGMRTDVFVGGVEFVWQERDAAASAERAGRIAAYYDRNYGHHNVYGSYGDEPGESFFTKNRGVFDAYQRAGIKFIIASGRHIVPLAGFRWNWHNSSSKPTDPTLPALWNEMGDGTRCAWYADQHVGSENPEFNRRQNGLAAYLSGYSALCNYAHHLGPYNDDSEMYKPMVFAYGTADGVIDTLQWEGFREGIDDIRYATLMTALAREAALSDDIDVSHLGRKAKLLLATFDREAGDLNAVRREMILFIEKLRAALGGRADAILAAGRETPSVKRPPAGPSDDVPVPRDAAEARDAAARLAKEYRWREQVAVLLGAGLKLEAAEVLRGRSEGDTRRALALAEEDLSASVAAKNRARVLAAWKFLLENDFATADRHLAEVRGLAGDAAAADGYIAFASGTRAAGDGDWSAARKAYGRALEIDGGNTNRAWNLKSVQYAIPAFLETGDFGRINEICGLGLASAARGNVRPAFKPEDVYQLNMAVSVLGAADAADAARLIGEADAKFGAGIDPKLRRGRIERLASFAMCANRGEFARGAAEFLAKAFVKNPEKLYTVRFSPRRVLGLGNWDECARALGIGTEKLDRNYGGDTTCLITDVATGRADVKSGSAKGSARDPEWQAMADEWGIHFRLEIFDGESDATARGELSAGSLEGYLAPGENTPYYCLLHTLEPGGFSVYNGVYEQPGHKWIDAKDRAACREDVLYGKESVVLYWALSWEKFATRVPDSSSRWEFEPMFWGRGASRSWNGLETIHGRSSWGRLAFDITAADRRRILRPLLFRARKTYEDEKRCYGAQNGVLARWRNEETGDPAFCEAELKGLVERLDEASKRVASGMDDAAVDELERTALPDWFDFRFTVRRLRADYLLRNLIPEKEGE